MDQERPLPRFKLGDVVRVRLNERNRTPRIGVIHASMWHFKEEQYYYYITVVGKTVVSGKVSKHYREIDLEPVDDPERGMDWLLKNYYRTSTEQR